jgi:hypothetical protein
LFTGSSVYKNGFSGIVLGAADAGNITVGGTNTFVDSVTLLSGGNITLNASSSVSSSQASGHVVAAATGNFINNAGSAALSTTDAGSDDRWIVYSADPGTAQFGTVANGDLSSGNLAFWGSTYSSLPPASVGSGKRYVFASNNQTVSATVETTNASKTYGSAAIDLISYVSVSAAASANGPYLTTASGSYTLADLFSTLPSLTSLGNTTTASVSSGPYAITASSGVVKPGFSVSFINNGLLSITPKTITVAGTFTGSKVYDGLLTVAGSGTGTSFGGVINGDVVTLSGITGTFADRHVGIGKTFTVSGLTLGGAGAANYTFDPASTVTGLGSITQLASVTWAGAAAGPQANLSTVVR